MVQPSQTVMQKTKQKFQNIKEKNQKIEWYLHQDAKEKLKIKIVEVLGERE